MWAECEGLVETVDPRDESEIKRKNIEQIITMRRNAFRSPVVLASRDKTVQSLRLDQNQLIPVNGFKDDFSW